jgi:hypothetical protein
MSKGTVRRASETDGEVLLPPVPSLCAFAALREIFLFIVIRISNSLRSRVAAKR